MGGRDKGLLAWQGLPMVEHLQRLGRPLTNDLIISCNRNFARYGALADQVIADGGSGYAGPLAGIRMGLRVMRESWLLVLPCDLPRLDLALLNQMRQGAAHTQRPLLLQQGEQAVPLPCIVPRSSLATLEKAWAQGERSPRRWLQQQGAARLHCAVDDPRLYNFNTPDYLSISA
jgi:molybdenum cofactor guanylyltransferase